MAVLKCRISQGVLAYRTASKRSGSTIVNIFYLYGHRKTERLVSTLLIMMFFLRLFIYFLLRRLYTFSTLLFLCLLHLPTAFLYKTKYRKPNLRRYKNLRLMFIIYTFPIAQSLCYQIVSLEDWCIQVRFINFIPMQFFHKSLHTP